MTSTPPSPPPTSHPSPPHTRAQSIQNHAPLTPSALRESHTLSSPDGSPENVRHSLNSNNPPEGREGSSLNSSRSKRIKSTDDEGEEISGSKDLNPKNQERKQDGGLERDENTHSETSSLLSRPRETPSLLRNPLDYFSNAFSTREPPHPGPCNHGTFSPTFASREGSINNFGGPLRAEYGTIGGEGNGNGAIGSRVPTTGSMFSGSGSAVGGSSRMRMLGMGGRKMSTTNWMAERHGITNMRTMFLAYYIPFLSWLPQYRWSFLRGDIAAALTMASFYLPMALSYASNLSHLPPINGLYAFAFQPLIYAFLGSCPQMVVGPEAAGSLLVGSVVRSSINKGHAGEDDGEINARIAGVVTGLAGAVIFAAGLARLGFLDSVLSRPFLRGFISAIGFVIIVDQLIPEMGLESVARTYDGVLHGSSVVKLKFLFEHVMDAHALTCAVAGSSFVVIMLCRELKKRLQPRFPNVAYVPDRFFVVVLSAVLCHSYGWDQKGLEILGEVKSATGSPFSFHWPFRFSQMHHIQEAMSTAFLIALLGFFESSVAAKSLAGSEVKRGEGIEGIALSPNRELVALGVANLIGGCFAALPAFGGYGRSKVNASTGGKTPMSSIFLSIITVICVLFLLPYFYYLPKAVLSSMITVVAYSLLEESPHDISFFLRIRGTTELLLMLTIFLTTIFYSLSLGIACGIGLSILSVLKHSTRPRIQILGRIPNTNKFANAESLSAQNLEFIEGCLIVKIPEPLTFANTGELKSRLRRLEIYGNSDVHPAMPRVREERHNRNVIFDIHGVTGMDGSGTQVLAEIVKEYRERGVRVYFSRGPPVGSDMWKLFERSGILRDVGGEGSFFNDVSVALEAAERDDEVVERV